MKRNKKGKDRWSSVEDLSPNDLTADLAADELTVYKKQLEKFFRDCQRWKPEYFREMSLPTFEAWNNQRLAHLDDPPEEQTTEQARAEIKRNCGQ